MTIRCPCSSYQGTLSPAWEWFIVGSGTDLVFLPVGASLVIAGQRVVHVDLSDMVSCLASFADTGITHRTATDFRPLQPVPRSFRSTEIVLESNRVRAALDPGTTTPTNVTKTIPRFAIRSKNVLMSPCSSKSRLTSSLLVSY